MEDADIVFTTLPNGLILRAVARQVRSNGLEALDAPVSGGTVEAGNGTLTFMVGGTTQTFDSVEPAIKAMGPKDRALRR